MMRVCNLDMSDGHCHPEPGAAEAFQGETGVCGELHAVYSPGAAGVHGGWVCAPWMTGGATDLLKRSVRTFRRAEAKRQGGFRQDTG